MCVRDSCKCIHLLLLHNLNSPLWCADIFVWMYPPLLLWTIPWTIPAVMCPLCAVFCYGLVHFVNRDLSLTQESISDALKFNVLRYAFLCLSQLGCVRGTLHICFPLLIFMELWLRVRCSDVRTGIHSAVCLLCCCCTVIPSAVFLCSVCQFAVLYQYCAT
jgi:hypothetical protein